MAYYLKQITRSNSFIIIPLTEAEVIVGSNDTQLRGYSQISEQHANFYKIEDRIYIKDLHSLYGTYVNGIKIEPGDSKCLTHADVIGFGISAKSAENGFVCMLICEPFEESNITRNQSVLSIKKEPQEIIDISQDDDYEKPNMPIDSIKIENSTSLDLNTSDVQKNTSSLHSNMEDLIKKDWEHTKNFTRQLPSTSNGPFEESNITRNQSVLSIKKEPPEIIDISQDDDYEKPNMPMDSIKIENSTSLDLNTSDVQKNTSSLHLNMEDLIKEDWEHTKNFTQQLPSTSNGHTSVKRSYPLPRTKKCLVPLIKCDSRSFLWPPDVENPVLLESEDEDILTTCKKRSKRISSDSSVESSEEELPTSFLKHSKSKQNQFNNNINVNKNSSREHSDYWKNLFSRRKKRARKISSDSDESSVESNSSKCHNSKKSFPNQSYWKNLFSRRKKHARKISSDSDESSVESNSSKCHNSKKSFLNQSETENIPSSGSVALPELSSTDFSVAKTDKKVTLNKNVLNTCKVPKLSTSNSSIDSLNHNFHLSALNKSNIETDACSSHKNYQMTEIGKYDLKKSLEKMESHPEEENYHKIDSRSLAEEINVSAGVFDTDLIQNSIPIKTEFKDAENPESDSMIKEIFGGDHESEILSSSSLSQNSAFNNQETESIEAIQQYVNSAQRNLVESESGRNKELNCKLSESEIEMSLREDIQPSGKSPFRNSKSDVKKSSKSCRKTLLTDPKPMPYRPRKMRGRDEGYVERQKTVDPYPKRKRGRPRKEQPQSDLNSSVTIAKNPDKSAEYYTYIQKQLPEISEKSQKKIPVNDYLKNKGLPSFSGTKGQRRNTKPTVKVRPDKLSSHMAFLTNGVEAKPVREKISGNGKKNKGSSNAEKNDASQTQFANKIKTDEMNAIPGNDLPTFHSEDKHPEQKRSNILHTLQDNNSEGSVLQKISHSLTNALDIDTLHVKNLKDVTYQDISHYSADVPSTCALQVKNLENRNLQNIPHSLIDVSHRISMHTENIQLPFEISFDGMVKSLLKLRPIWLQEQLKNFEPPPEVMQGVETLPLCFTSYESYAASFYPLLKLKIWQYMFDKSKEMLANKKMRFRIISFENKPDYIELKCESVVNDEYCFEPNEGMMAVLKMYLKSNTITSLFGFIVKHKVSTLKTDLLHSCWKKLSPEYFKDAKRWIFHVWIKQKELLLEPDILMEGSGICYLRSNLRLADALHCLKDSPLMTDIIEPRLQTFALSCSNSSSSRKNTALQSEIIQAICSEIYKPYLECKISLIHEPHNMGETHIVIGILETLFFASKHNSNLKVLVTAPSNQDIDEIGHCLIELNERYCLNNNASKFVRVGVEKSVDSKMLPYFIDRKAAELYKKDKERELQALRLKILNLEKEPNSLHKNKKLKSLKDQCKFIEDNISLKTGYYKTMIKYKCDILKETNVVLTTLSSCNLSLLCKTFLPTPKSDLNFSCCIVAKSTQCSEIEILQPLIFGISKLILVDDEKQLSATHSEYTNKFCFNRSVFKRFCQYFRSSSQPNPVVYLTE